MPGNEKPKTVDEYVAWARDNLGANFGGPIKRQYENNQVVAASTVAKHPFFSGLSQFLNDVEAKYFSEQNHHLLMESDVHVFNLDHKSYASALDKVFRINVVHNKEWPAELSEGWLTHDNWFSRLDDILRGTIVCKYIDGPEILGRLLKTYADGCGVSCSLVSRQLDRGYYAYHFYVDIPVEIADLQYEAVNINLKVEIQLTTQLQEVMYKITHIHYTNERSKLDADRENWKWDVKSNRFKAGYIAHTLHLLEAIILELRDSASAPLEQESNSE
jgi:ppGpp synthetase/RelA/SpoT-type nucleotidyltranferase